MGHYIISVILCQVYYVMTIAIFALDSGSGDLHVDILFPLVMGLEPG